MSTMSDPPVTVSIFNRFQRELFVHLEGLETRLTARVDAVNTRVDEVYGHIDGLYHRLDRLETEYEAIRVGLGRVEDRLG